MRQIKRLNWWRTKTFSRSCKHTIFNIKQIIVMHQNSFVAVAIDLSLMVANQICRDRAIRSVILGDSFLSSGLAFSSPVQWFLIYIWQQLLEMNKCLLSIQSMCTAWLSTVNFLTRWKFKSLYKVIHTTNINLKGLTVEVFRQNSTFFNLKNIR